MLVVSHERLRQQMSGPSIRNWELAHALAAENDVTLAAPGEPERGSTQVRVEGYDGAGLGRLVKEAQVVLCSGFLIQEHPVLLQAEYLAVDLYGPFELEHLHQRGEMTASEHDAMALAIRRVLFELLLAGDVFFCASERQRDFWLGWLDAAGRVNPATHQVDPGYESMVRLLPFGLSPEPPRPGAARFRGVLPGVAAEDFLVLWGGGIWDWFDPLSLIRAAAATAERVPRLRVVFPVSSPSEKVPPHGMEVEARKLADALGLTGKRIFFNKSWVPYDERGQMYLEADVGVSLHRKDIETRFSFRTRVLEYLWAGLPIITTEGDSLAEIVKTEDLGSVVPYDDVEQLATALQELAGDPLGRGACAERARATARRFEWPVVAEPLLEYCRSPFQAVDRAAARSRLASLRANQPALAEVSRLLRRSFETLRRQGAGPVLGKGKAYLRRRVQRRS